MKKIISTIMLGITIMSIPTAASAATSPYKRTYKVNGSTGRLVKELMSDNGCWANIHTSFYYASASHGSRIRTYDSARVAPGLTSNQYNSEASSKSESYYNSLMGYYF